ncbi:MAG: hypothetical protein MJ166_00055 [Clostridia bacterium]|nr:hypothetical protein [Clostridia bacterium]
MKNYHLTVMSPDGEIFNDDVISLVLRGAEGDLAIFSGHIPFITSVRPGKCVITLTNEEEIEGHLESGILNVSKDSVSLLVGDKNLFKKS